MQLKGIHHVSAITANAQANVDFYTKVLGLRLVKKTVNQDDPSMYHLFYADAKGTPGTELTFFEIPMAGRTYPGTNSISETSLRAPNDKALLYWKQRFEQFAVKQENIQQHAGRATLAFIDFEGQRLRLVSDENNDGVAGGEPWEKSSVPNEVAIIGLGPVQLTVRNEAMTAEILTTVMGYRWKGRFSSAIHGQSEIFVYETGEGGTGSEIHLVEQPDLPVERPGRGSVHHVAFRVADEEQLRSSIGQLTKARIPNSSLVDRFYFKAVYFREPNGILFELSTDGPGFDVDEPMERLGETLALPPFLEVKREEIEAKLKPIT